MEEKKVSIFTKLKAKLRIETEDVKTFQGPYINTWIRFALYILVVFLTGCSYWGWNGIQVLLYKAGSYEDVCAGATDISYMIIGGKGYIDCGLRKSGINNLYTIAFAAHFMSSIFGGFALDWLGPKVVFIASQSISLLSWILITTMPKNTYILNTAFFFIGFTVESGYLPLLTVAHYFPKNTNLIISVMGSVRSISFVIPTILGAIFEYNSFTPNMLYVIGLIYAVAGILVSILIGGFLLQKRFHYTNKLASQSVEPVMADEEEEVKSMNSSEVVAFMANAIEPKKESLGSKILNLIKHPQSWEYVIAVMILSLFMCAIQFVNKAQREIFVTTDGKSVVEIFKIFNILTFIPGPFFGMLTDKIGPGLLLTILNLCCVFMYLFAYFDSYATKVIACLFYVLSGSLCISSMYCYLTKRFPAKNFGVLVGISFLFAGAVSLTNIPIYDWASLKLKPFSKVIFLFIGLSLISAKLCVLMLYITREKKPKDEKIIKQAFEV